MYTYVIKHHIKIQRDISRDFKEEKTSKVIWTFSAKHTFLTHIKQANY